MNTYTGENGGRFSDPANWSDNSGNWNCDCVIDGKTVVYDATEDEVFKIGRLFLSDATLTFTNDTGTASLTLTVGDILISGASTVTVNSNWNINSNSVKVSGTSTVILEALAYWNVSNDFTLTDDAVLTHNGGGILARFVNAGPLTTLNLSSGILGYHVVAGGVVNVAYLGSGEQVLSGNVTLAAVTIEATKDGCGYIRCYGDLEIANVVEVNVTGSGSPQASYPFAEALGELGYVPGDVSILGTTFYVDGSTVSDPTDRDKVVLTWLPGTSGPSAPTGVAAVSPVALVINVTWNAVSGATSYSVYRSTSSGAQGSTPYRTGLLTTAFADTVSPGTYYYKVTALNATGESAQSSEVSATA